jgi:type IV pilus assembly protein PilA
LLQREHADARAVERSEAGFTLIELMMVVLIIAILISVLIPTFFGARDRANDRAMQSALRNAATAAKAVYVDNEDYTDATAVRLNIEGLPVVFVDAGTVPTNQNTVSIDTPTSTYAVISGLSKSGKCFYVSDDVSSDPALAGTHFAVQTGVTCEASGAPAQGDVAWQSQW